MGAYAGVDWASEAHAACVVDETGRVTVERVVGHDERGVAELCDLLVGEGVQRVALERPDGVLVERLVDAGLVVLAIHPNLGQGRPRALYRRPHEVRPPRRLRPRRAGPHRCPSLPGPASRLGRDQGAAGADARPRGPRRRARALGQRAACGARALLAGGGAHLQRGRLADRPCLLRALSEPGRRPRARRAAPRGLPRPRALLRSALGGRAAQPAAPGGDGPPRSVTVEGTTPTPRPWPPTPA